MLLSTYVFVLSITNLNKTQLEILANKFLEISTYSFVSGTRRT